MAVVVVTGANKGIGFEIVKILCKNGCTVIATARDLTLGRDALKKWNSEGFKPELVQLDVQSKQDAVNLRKYIDANHKGVLNCLVNNAGFAYKGEIFGFEEAKVTLGINYYGVRNVCEALIPLVRATKGRIVNVASQAGQLKQVSKPLQERFSSPKLELDELDSLLGDFLNAIKADDLEKKGWPRSMYGMSKLACIAYTKILAHTYKDVTVTCCCPGWCATDMSSNEGERSAAKGAETPAWLAIDLAGVDPSFSGQFFYDLKPIEW